MQADDSGVIEELQKLRAALGDVDAGQDVNVQGRPLRTLRPGRYSIKETANLSDANDSGTVTIAPGDTATLARHTSDNGTMLLAVGANDDPNVRYQLVVDSNRVVGGTTQAPLGTLTQPFSFVETLNGAIPADGTIEYRAEVDDDASAPVELAAIMHVDDLPGGGV